MTGQEKGSQRGWYSRLVSVVSVIYVVFIVLYVLGLLPLVNIWLEPSRFLALTLVLTIVLAFLIVPTKGGLAKGKDRLPWYDLILMLLGVVGPMYIFILGEALYYHDPITSVPEQIMGITTILVLFEINRRIMGWVIPILSLAFFFYILFGNYLPGLLNASAFSLSRAVYSSFLLSGSGGGILGGPFAIICTVVFTFLLFGAFLQVSGGAKFMTNMVFSLVGSARGGPAKVAVLASAAFGSVSGSPTANVSSTGIITIPMMKSLGYKPHFAGGVEAAASTGGTILPPVMGTAAFIMAEFLEIPYVRVCAAAALPAILYFIVVFVSVHFESMKLELKGLPREQVPSFWKGLKSGWYFILPAGVLVYYLVVRSYSPQTAGMYATGALVLVSMFSRETRLTGRKILAGIVGCARSMIQIAPVVSIIGIVLASVSLTGLGVRLPFALRSIAGDNLLMLAIVAAVAAFVLGMGVQLTSSYILLSVLVAPALVVAGVQPIAAHLFIMYCACLCFITPPVATASYVAASIAGAPMMRTALEACRLGLVLFLMPFLIIYKPALAGLGTPLEIAESAVTAIVAVVMLAGASSGYMFGNLSWLSRAFLIGGGLVLFIPSWQADLLGVGVFAAVGAWQWYRRKSVKGRQLTSFNKQTNSNKED